MEILMNFTTSPDDLTRYRDSEDLHTFFRNLGCSGLELMPIGTDTRNLIQPAMITGIHANCFSDWMDTDQEYLVRHYRKDLEYARQVHAKYVVFHVTQVSYSEALTCRPVHTDQEVVQAAARLINALLEHQDYDFWFLMENLWWPGLNFQDPEITKYLLDEVRYEKKGFMLDTGHFMNTNPELRTSDDAVACLHSMLDRHKDILPFIKGLHLNQSLSGSYMKAYMKSPSLPPEDPDLLFCQAFEHIFRIDQHLPFTDPGVSGLLKRICPKYVTLEYITKNRQEHEEYLREGLKWVLPRNKKTGK